MLKSFLCWFLTFIANATHLPELALSALGLNSLFVQLFVVVGNNLCKTADYSGDLHIIHFAITHGRMST